MQQVVSKLASSVRRLVKKQAKLKLQEAGRAK
jgi:hypothetical protein